LSSFDEHLYTRSDYLLKVINRKKAVRHFRRKEAAGESEERRVRSCLLEFGETFMTKSDRTGGGSNETAAVEMASGVQAVSSSPVMSIAEAAVSAVVVGLGTEEVEAEVEESRRQLDESLAAGKLGKEVDGAGEEVGGAGEVVLAEGGVQDRAAADRQA